MSVYANTLVINGRIAGVWKRMAKKNSVAIEFNSFTPLTESENEAVVAAARQYRVFPGLHFQPRTEFHTKVAMRGDWLDRTGAFWLVACVFGPSFSWIVATGTIPITPDT